MPKKLFGILSFLGILFCVMLGKSAAEERIIIPSVDFEKGALALSFDDTWKNTDGVLTNNLGTGMQQIYINNLALENFSISFAAKLLSGSGDNTFLGVCFDLAGNRMLMAYSFPNRFNLLETEKGQSSSAPAVQHITVSSYSKEIAIGENSAFSTFRVEIRQGKGDVFRDGKYLGRFEAKPGIVNRIRLVSWNGGISIKNVEIKKLTTIQKGEKL